MMRLYYWEHCPFCARVRMVAGWKALQLELRPLGYADDEALLRLSGARVVPVLEKQDGSLATESMELAEYLNDLGGERFLADRPADYEGSALKQWLESVFGILVDLYHPRCVQLSLAEFATPADRALYENNKLPAGYSSFADMLERSSGLLAQGNQSLRQLDALLPGPYVQRQPSYGDVLLFPMLRCLSVAKGLHFSAKVKDYMQRITAETGVETYFDRAL